MHIIYSRENSNFVLRKFPCQASAPWLWCRDFRQKFKQTLSDFRSANKVYPCQNINHFCKNFYSNLNRRIFYNPFSHRWHYHIFPPPLFHTQIFPASLTPDLYTLPTYLSLSVYLSFQEFLQKTHPKYHAYIIPRYKFQSK